MSVQNTLKKPEFTKTMLGYNPQEVDRYIEYLTERYAAVSRDVSELKRRLTRLQLGLDTPEAENNTPDRGGFSDAAVDRLRHMIFAERNRHEEALDALLEFIESHKMGEGVKEAPSFDDEFVPLDDEDCDLAPREEQVIADFGLSEEDEEWTETLDEFIEDAGEDAEDELEIELDIELDDEGETETETETEAKAEEARTPAQLAAELDFYSDSVVRDGESYDPMTLAHSATMKRKRPTAEDFLNPIEDGRK